MKLSESPPHVVLAAACWIPAGVTQRPLAFWKYVTLIPMLAAFSKTSSDFPSRFCSERNSICQSTSPAQVAAKLTPCRMNALASDSSARRAEQPSPCRRMNGEMIQVTPRMAQTQVDFRILITLKLNQSLPAMAGNELVEPRLCQRSVSAQFSCILSQACLSRCTC